MARRRKGPKVRIFTLKGYEEEFNEITEFLKEHGIYYRSLLLFNADEIYQLRKMFPKARKFPVVIIDDRYIGYKVEDVLRWLDKYREENDIG